MSHTTEPTLWDERSALIAILDELLHRPRDPLTTGSSRTGPGLYAVFYRCRRTGPRRLDSTPGTAALEQVDAATWPVYVGSALSVRERFNRHLTNAAHLIDIEPGELWTLELPLRSHAASLYAEALVIDALQPVWNQYWCRGFGSRDQGPTRTGQAPSPFSRLHRISPRGPRSEAIRDELAESVRRHLMATVFPHRGWTPMR